MTVNLLCNQCLLTNQRVGRLPTNQSKATDFTESVKGLPDGTPVMQ